MLKHNNIVELREAFRRKGKLCVALHFSPLSRCRCRQRKLCFRLFSARPLFCLART
jgi:hypothetical protein